MEKEIWKDIEGYEGVYQVSNLGRIKSVARVMKSNNQYKKYRRKLEERILIPAYDKDGYLKVGLCKQGKVKECKIHRAVAQAFLPNPEKYPVVNHKDENPSNNTLANLEWCTVKYNQNYGTAIQRGVKRRYKKIKQYDLNGNFIKSWNSVKEASEKLNIGSKNISSCLTGRLEKAYGFKWKYANEKLKQKMKER